MTSRLSEKMRGLNDDQWMNLLVKSISQPHIDGVDFPGFPPEQIQANFVGSSNETTLKEAFTFYKLVKEQARELQKPISRKGRFLDFGCGWGRYLRFFWKDVDEENLFGVDVDQTIVDTCHALNVPGQVDCINPFGTLPYPDNYFDAIIAYSVFTHLPEKVHMLWLKELSRVARPGCVFCLTLEPRRFIDFVANVPADSDSIWYRTLAKHKPRMKEFYDTFEAGGLVFMPTNGGMEDYYGDAVVPTSFIDKNWPPYFQPRTYIDDPNRFWQAVLIAQSPW